ncbi:MAG: UDP-3-O-acyl-N-acetylglucosamine deacetylase, partial [Thiotrichaceae bacterium]|nr:UDP-3-O-acyl-N-acetylglucosamine deacetylase [Thiotrichaceae bacterium]
MNTVNSLQRTLKQSVSFVGLGLHSGVKSRITLKPCEDASGIFFKRMDVPERQALIAARWYKISDTTLSTVLTNQHGISVSTVEHLMAALTICGIDNLIIELDGPEIPIMDGSAKPFVDTLMKIGTRSLNAVKKAIWIHKTIKVQKGNQYALLSPGTQSKIT